MSPIGGYDDLSQSEALLTIKVLTMKMNPINHVVNVINDNGPFNRRVLISLLTNHTLNEKHTKIISTEQYGWLGMSKFS